MTLSDWILATDRGLQDAINLRVPANDVLSLLRSLSASFEAQAVLHGHQNCADWSRAVKVHYQDIREAMIARTGIVEQLKRFRKRLAVLVEPIKRELACTG